MHCLEQKLLSGPGYMNTCMVCNKLNVLDYTKSIIVDVTTTPKIMSKSSYCLIQMALSKDKRDKEYYDYQVRINKSIPRVTVWHHKARSVVPSIDIRNKFVQLYLTLMSDSYIFKTRFISSAA